MKFCFQKCIWVFFCGNLCSQNVSRLLCRYCYKIFWKIKSNIYCSCVVVNNTLLTFNSGTKFCWMFCMTQIFEKLATCTKFWNILFTFCPHFQLRKIYHWQICKWYLHCCLMAKHSFVYMWWQDGGEGGNNGDNLGLLHRPQNSCLGSMWCCWWSVWLNIRVLWWRHNYTTTILWLVLVLKNW